MQQQDTGYNGWANRPTWLAHLNISNDKLLYCAARTLKNSKELRLFAEVNKEDLPDAREILSNAGRIHWGEVLRALKE